MRRALTSLMAVTVLQTVWTPVAVAQSYPYFLPLNDKVLTPAEVALQRYKRQRLSVKMEGENWQIVQGINVTIPDEQLLQLAGMSSRVKDQRTKDLYGGLITASGAAVGIFGILSLVGVVPLGDDIKMGVGFSTLGLGIVIAGLGELLFPMALPGDHFMSIEEARNAVMQVNARTKSELGVPLETPD